MSPRSPYLVSTLGHMAVLAGLATLAMLRPPLLQVPAVRIVSFGSSGGGGAKSPAATVTKPAPAAQPAAPEPAVEPPKPAAKLPVKEPTKPPVKKTPPPKEPKAADRRGALPSSDPGMISKTKPEPGPARRQPPAEVASAASRGGEGAAAGSGRGGVGIEAQGDNGQGSWYWNQLREKVADAWQAPAAIGKVGEAVVIVHFMLQPGGRPDPESVSVLSSSHVPEFDRAAMRAVLDAAPFPPLPPDLGTEAYGIRLTFTQKY